MKKLDVSITISVSPAMAAAIQRLAYKESKASRVSQSEIIRRALRAYLPGGEKM